MSTNSPTPEQTSENKPKQQTNRQFKDNRPRFRFSRNSTSRFKPYANNNLVRYNKEAIYSSLSTVPTRSVFPIYCSNLGVTHLSNSVYNAINGRDFRIGRAITPKQLEYVTAIAFYNRLQLVALENGYCMSPAASYFKQISAGIQLPLVLAKYVEALGYFRTAGGLNVAPWCLSYEMMLDPSLMRIPEHIIAEAGRPVPQGPWHIDVEWIVAYNDAVSRASKSGMLFRIVDNKQLSGRIEMLVSYKSTQENLLVPYTPEVVLEVEAQLGACYRFRDINQLATWPATKELLYGYTTCLSVNADIYISHLCSLELGSK